MHVPLCKVFFTYICGNLLCVTEVCLFGFFFFSLLPTISLYGSVYLLILLLLDIWIISSYFLNH